MSQEAFWDIEHAVDTRISARDTFIGPASTSDVREFCRRYHYTHIGNNINWRWGLWHQYTLLGVVTYNLPTRSVCASVFGEDHLDKVWHMGRLALADIAPRNCESRLIAGSLRAISAEYPNVWAVLTYAATDAGHIGYVYQATNAIYTGEAGDPTYYIDATGARRGTHLDGRGVSASRAAEMGWTKASGGPKHRYVYVLGNRRERLHRRQLLRYPQLPYPKPAA